MPPLETAFLSEFPMRTGGLINCARVKVFGCVIPIGIDGRAMDRFHRVPVCLDLHRGGFRVGKSKATAEDAEAGMRGK